MDFHVCIIWEGEEVRTRYYQSEFMGHATAEKMLSVFETATSDLDFGNLLQLSMDGPNVNWKLYDLIQSRLQKDCHKSMLTTGSCVLSWILFMEPSSMELMFLGGMSMSFKKYALVVERHSRSEKIFQISHWWCFDAFTFLWNEMDRKCAGCGTCYRGVATVVSICESC